MKKIVVRTLLSIICILCIALAGLFYLASSESGTRILISYAERLTGSDLNVGHSKGALTGPFELENVTYLSKSVELRIGHIKVDWELSGLLVKKLDIHQIDVVDVDYKNLGTEDDTRSETFPYIVLPVDVHLESLIVDSIDLLPSPSASALRINRVAATADFTDERFALNDLTVDAPDFELSGHLGLVPIEGGEVSGEIEWQTDFIQTSPVIGKIKVSGTLDDIGMAFDIEPPHQVTGHARIKNLTNQPGLSFSIEGNEISLSNINSAWPDIILTGIVLGQRSDTSKNITLEASVNGSNIPQLGRLEINYHGELSDDEITIANLRLTSPDTPGAANASGKVAFGEGEPTFSINSFWSGLTWPLSGTPLLTGDQTELRISGPLSNLALDLQTDLTGPNHSESVIFKAMGDFSNGIETINVNGTVKDLNIRGANENLVSNARGEFNLQGTLPVLNGTLNITLEDQVDSPVIRAVTVLDLSDTQTPVINIDTTWTNLRWPLNGKELLVESETGRFNLSGVADNFLGEFSMSINNQGQLLGTVSYQNGEAALAANWDNLSWMYSPYAVTSKAGKIEIHGLWDNYELAMETGMQADGKSIQLAATGHGDRSSLELEHLSMGLLRGEISGTAKLDWETDFTVNTELSGKNLDPSFWLPDWPGNIEGEIYLDTAMHREEVLINTLRLHASGELRGYPLKAELAGSGKTNALRLDRALLRSGQSELLASGTIGEQIDLQWNIESDDLQDFLPLAHGKINGSGRISGAKPKPVITINLTGEEISYQGNELDSLAVKGLIDTSDIVTSGVEMQAQGKLGGVQIGSAILKANGFMSDHSISLDAESAEGNLNLALEGRVQNGGDWLFKINRAVLSSDTTGNWELKKGVDGKLSKTDFLLSNACFSQNSAEVCVRGRRVDGDSDGHFTLSKLPLSVLNRQLPKALSIKGRVDGKGEISVGEQGVMNGVFTLKTSSGQLLLESKEIDAEVPLKILAFEPGELDVNIVNSSVKVALNLPLAGPDRIQGRVQISGDETEFSRRLVDARLDVQIEDVGFLSAVVPEIETIKGRLQGNFLVSGSVGSPEFAGDIQWLEGSMSLITPGIVLTDIAARMQGNFLGGMELSLKAYSGGGAAGANGSIHFANNALEAEIVLKGENLLVVNTPHLQIYASPDLDIKMDYTQLNVRGDVGIPQASIEIQKKHHSAIVASSDQIIVSDTVAVDSSNPKIVIDAKVRTILGDQVYFDGFGLTGKLGGEIVSIEHPSSGTSVKGEIRILNGKYSAYGQNLTIDTGRLLFAGNGAINPSLDLRASRQPTKEVNVGVNARGTLQQPEFSLISTPAMSERNKLSYLLLGRPAETTSNEERTELSLAALAFGLQRADGFTSKLSDQLGLDQLGIEAEPGTTYEQQAFVLGKYLSPKLYLSYGIGLFEPVNTVRLQYSVNEHWKLVTESSDQSSGGDILYSVESGD